MTDMLKKLRKKYKRHRLLREKAKLEKIHEKDQAGEYKKKISRHKKRMIERIVLSVVAVLIVVMAALLLLEKHTYHDYKVITGSDQEDVVSTQYMEMSGKILRYSTDGASLINSKLEAQWSSLFEMQNPVASVRGDWAVIADVDGTLLEIFDKNGETGSITTSYTIVKARISAGGMVAAILDGGDATWINFYSSDGTLIAENQTNIADPGYPMDVAVSDAGNVMMVAYQFVDGSDTTSYVAFYNFGDAGQSEEDRIVSGYTYEGVVVPQIQYLKGSEAVALRDDGFTTYSGEQVPKEETTIEVEEEIVSTFFDEDTIGLVFKNGDAEKQYTMKVYSRDGKEKFAKDFNIPYTTIKMSDGNIIMYNSSQICVVNSRGSEKFNGTVDGTVSDFLKIGWRKYLLVTDSGVSVIKFK